MIIVYLRNVGDDEDPCWVVCARFDEGAVAFCPTSQHPSQNSKAEAQ